jgi:hypothetical protein
LFNFLTLIIKQNIFMKKASFNLSTSLICLALIGLFTFSSCKKDSNTVTPAPISTTFTYEVASGSNFTILEAAVVKANLATTLSGTGPYTVFAPSDSAFMTSGITINTINSLSSNFLKKHFALSHTFRIGKSCKCSGRS